MEHNFAFIEMFVKCIHVYRPYRSIIDYLRTLDL